MPYKSQDPAKLSLYLRKSSAFLYDLLGWLFMTLKPGAFLANSAVKLVRQGGHGAFHSLLQTGRLRRQ